MAAIPVARMLFELGVPGAATGLAEAKASQRCGNCRGESEIRAEIEQAHARGVAEGLERGRSERMQSEQELLASLQDRQDARLSALANEARTSLDAGLAGVHAEMSKAVGRALAAFFQGRIEHEATAALSNELTRIISEHGAARVTIRGPEPWIDRLAALGEVMSGVAKLDVQANDSADVTITIDGTVLETTVGAWLDGLGSAL